MYKRTEKCLAVVTLLALALLAGCQESGGSSNPFAHCPAAQHRMRDVTHQSDYQWVCVR